MVNQRLIKDIKMGLAEGWPLQKLRGYLVSQGYNPIEVDRALPSTAGRMTVQQKAERPTAVTILAVLFFIGGVSGVFGLIFNIISGSLAFSTMPFLGELYGGFVIYLGILSAFIGVLDFLVAWGLWNLKNWARITAIVLSVLSMLTIIGIPIAILFIYLLVKKSTKEAFLGS